MWLLFVLLATIFWALSDICNDAAIELHEEAPPPSPNTQSVTASASSPTPGAHGHPSAFSLPSSSVTGDYYAAFAGSAGGHAAEGSGIAPPFASSSSSSSFPLSSHAASGSMSVAIPDDVNNAQQYPQHHQQQLRHYYSSPSLASPQHARGSFDAVSSPSSASHCASPSSTFPPTSPSSYHSNVPPSKFTTTAAASVSISSSSSSSSSAAPKGLSGEQSAFVNVVVTAVFVSIAYLSGITSLSLRSFADNWPYLAVCGSLHFIAYLLLLKAFEDASSTEITPLLQTSAVWVFILQSLNNLGQALFFPSSDEVEFIRPLHFIAFVMIIVGGFLPLAHGNLRELATAAFWRNRVVILCVTSELLVATYSVILHGATYSDANASDDGGDDVIRADLSATGFGAAAAGVAGSGAGAGAGAGGGIGIGIGVGMVAAKSLSSAASAVGAATVSAVSGAVSNGAAALVPVENVELTMSSAHFFMATRIFSVLAGCMVFMFVPTMRAGAARLVRSPLLLRSATIKAVGDALSMAGLMVGAVPYGSFYEPAVINAAEGGLQQMCNLVLAVVLYRVGFGRRVAFLRTKLVSALIVSVGLLLSATNGRFSSLIGGVE